MRRLIASQKKYLVAAVIISILSAYCVLRILMPKQIYEMESAVTFENGEAVTGVVVCDAISLKPGVYQVQLEYQTNINMNNSCFVVDNTVYPGGLLTNGEPLCQGRNRTDFQMWLFETTDNLQVGVNYCGEGYLQTGSLVIRETGQLWSMLLAIIAGIACLWFGLMYFMDYDRIHLISKEKKTVFFWGTVIAFIASIPYLWGANYFGIDLIFHLERIEGVKDGLLSGQFPVRLSPEWIYGHGYADGVMYCNALLLFPAILRLLGFPVMTSYNLYCIALNIATVWIAYYSFSGIFKNRYIGLLCSGLYTLSIFRIYKLVITSATGEGSAVTFMPLILYGYFRVFTEDPKEKAYRTAWVPLAFGYAGLIQTHVLTCEITLFLTVVMCIAFFRRIFRKGVFGELCKGAAGAVVISLWFLVPFLDYFFREDLHVRHVGARRIQNVGLYPAQLAFHYWKVGSNSVGNYLGMKDSYPMGIGLILVIGFAVFGILWFSGKWKGKDGRIASVGKVSAVFGGMLMLMSLEVFPWDKIQDLNGVCESLVGSLEFPHRFLGWGTVFLVCVFGCCLWYFTESGDKWGKYIGIVVALAGITTSSMYLLDFMGERDSKLWIYNKEGMGFAYISDGEYLVQDTDLNQLGFGAPRVDSGTEILSYEKKYLHVRLNCRNTENTEGYVELPMLCYTGYRAYAEQTGEELEVGKGENNVVRIALPAYFSDTIEVKFVPPLHWRLSEAASYIGWLVLGAGGWVFMKRSRMGRMKKCGKQ